MKKFLLLAALAFALSVSAFAQATVNLGAHFTAAEFGGDRKDDVGVNGGVGYSFKFINAHAEAFANDGFQTRIRAGGFFSLPFKEFRFDAGGGYFCNGRCRDFTDGAYGHLGLNYGAAHGFARVGEHRFLEAEAAFDVAQFGDRVNVQAFGRGTRQGMAFKWFSQTQTVYQFGGRFVFGERK